MDPHVLDAPGKIHVVLQIKDGAAHAPLGQGETHGTLEVGHEARFFGVHEGFDRDFPVAHVV
jgi:hypothetical protein